ncbi:hypothetical protein M2447_001006 [Ereboglobus sp. PH5-10]|uniref:hypothetical protein n=1 Tax=Ereboglobus sp. PH5-10 TaxID=2940629 RepID=UPI00240516D9|nr:hypothetical protein [Ereboglobus sp. PH5-10]MDF9826921.1 hypothetical protein [Ereboglobus sp. PH5-10]
MNTRSNQESLNFLIKLFIVVSCYAVIILAPVKIGELGYLPQDDALRHSAYAVDSRDWGDVLVFNSTIRKDMDSHPAWHAVLRGVHNKTGAAQDNLVFFSFCVTFITFMVAGAIASRNTLAWMCTCLLMVTCGSSLFYRLLLGRPFSITMAILVVLLFLWTNPNIKNWKWQKEFGVVLGLLVVSICFHPSVWFVWPLPFLALCLCRQFRSAIILAAGTVAALIIACILCGSVYDIVILPVLQLFQAFLSDNIVVGNLVTEFQPITISDSVWIAMIVLLIIRKMCGDKIKEELQKPDFWLAVIGAILGLKVCRFMEDWAVPAMAVWICRQFIILSTKVNLNSFARLGVAIPVLAAFYIGTTGDVGSRYTRNLKDSLLTRPVADFESVLPDRGGILYASDMGVFYKLYFRNPNDHYRFILGFESGLMPPEDLKTLRRIQFSDGLIDEYAPWMEKMTSADRLVLRYPEEPKWENMEFVKFQSYWIGRKAPKKQSSPDSKEPKQEG